MIPMQPGDSSGRRHSVLALGFLWFARIAQGKTSCNRSTGIACSTGGNPSIEAGVAVKVR